jgi:hypothetical protein
VESRPTSTIPAHSSNFFRSEYSSLVMPKLTAPFAAHITTAPNGIREPNNLQAPPSLQLPGPLGSIISFVEPIQSLAAGVMNGLDALRDGRDREQSQRPKSNGGNNQGPPKNGAFGNGPFQNAPNVVPNLGPPPGNHKGNPYENQNHPIPGFVNGHVKCSTQEVSCSFLKEAAYQLQNDDDHCLKIATTFDQEGKIKFDPIVQDSDNVIYGITTDGLTASAWCNDIGWALRKIYTSCRRGKQCFGGKLICFSTAIANSSPNRRLLCRKKLCIHGDSWPP